jgi:flagellar protein FlaG
MDIGAMSNVGQSSPVTTERAPPVAETVTPAAVAAVAPAALPSLDEVKRAVQAINKVLQASSQGVEFSIDQQSGRTIIKVVDQNTKEIIRQMPSLEALEIAQALDKAQGLLIRQKA